MASFSDVVQAHIENAFTEIHTAFPAQVVRFDHDKQCADLQPCVKKRFKDGSVLALPILHNVPIIYPGAKDIIIGFDLEPDDTVLVLVCERSIDAWLSSDGTMIDPEDARKFNLSDAVAIPGFSPNSKKIPFDKKTLTIKYQKSSVVFTDANAIDINANSKLNINCEDDIVIHSAKSIEIKSDKSLNIQCNSASIKADKVSIDASKSIFSGDIECKKVVCNSLESQTTIKAEVEVIAGIVSLSKHIHGGVLSGGSVTLLPQG